MGIFDEMRYAAEDAVHDTRVRLQSRIAALEARNAELLAASKGLLWLIQGGDPQPTRAAETAVILDAMNAIRAAEQTNTPESD